MVASFPRQKVRWHARCLALALAAMLAAFSAPQVAVAQSGGMSGGYYRGGNVSIGDFGGFGYDAGPQTISGNVMLGGGAGLDLGCGSINIMDYMKATFNVSDIVEKGKAAMQTMLAKVVLTQLLAMPYISSAMNMLDGMLNAGFNMFTQSCDMSGIRAEAKKLLQARCESMHAGDHTAISNCVNWSDNVKDYMNAELKNLNLDLSFFNQDPIGQLQNVICGATGGDNDVTGACAVMGMLPRICLNAEGSAAGIGGSAGGCSGPKYRRPAVSAEPMAAAVTELTHATAEECAMVFDQIRKANPRITPHEIRAIGDEAGRLADDAMASGSSASLPPGNAYALVNMSYATKTFGAPGKSSEELLDQFRKTKLRGCADTVRDDPLRMCRFVAKAANNRLAKAGLPTIPEPQRLDPQKMDVRRMFDQEAVDAAGASGIDGETLAKMVVETFNCVANGQSGAASSGSHLTSPALMTAIATGDQVLMSGRYLRLSWSDASSSMSKRLSCDTIDKVLGFAMDKLDEGLFKVRTQQIIQTADAEVRNDDGTTSTRKGGPLETSIIKESSEEAITWAKGILQAQLDANRQACNQSLFGTGR